MKVFKITPNPTYGAGIALVSANNKEDAINTFLYDDDFHKCIYSFMRCSCEIINNLECKSNITKIIINDLYVKPNV